MNGQGAPSQNFDTPLFVNCAIAFWVWLGELVGVCRAGDEPHLNRAAP